MTAAVLNRRILLAAGGSVLVTGVSGLLLPARAQGLPPTASMSGGSNNYRKGAPTVDRIGKGGFWMSGTVRRAGRQQEPGHAGGKDGAARGEEIAAIGYEGGHVGSSRRVGVNLARL